MFSALPLACLCAGWAAKALSASQAAPWSRTPRGATPNHPSGCTPLSGGYMASEVAYFIGTSEVLDTGYKLTYGQQVIAHLSGLTPGACHGSPPTPHGTPPLLTCYGDTWQVL